MTPEILDRFLCCPLDRTGALSLRDAEHEAGRLISGTLVCSQCNTAFQVGGGIARLRPPREAQEAQVADAKERESRARDGDASRYDGTISGYHTEVELGALLDGLALSRSHVVLELGAGTGRLTVELAQRAGTVLAMDISPRSLEANRARCLELGLDNVHHVAVDACYLPIRDQSADRAASAMMLEHLPTAGERQRCVDEVRRALKPNGRFVLTAYNYSLRKRRKYPREGFHGADLYFYNFDTREMRGLLSQYRLRVLTALLNLPRRFQWVALDRAIARIPPLAAALGQLLFVVADR